MVKMVIFWENQQFLELMTNKKVIGSFWPGKSDEIENSCDRIYDPQISNQIDANEIHTFI